MYLVSELQYLFKECLTQVDLGFMFIREAVDSH
jgi:hypothetical protein